MNTSKNKTEIRGLKPASQKEESGFRLVLSYKNDKVILVDKEVNEYNFQETKNNNPEKIITVRKYLQPIQVPIKKVFVRYAGNGPCTSDLSHYDPREDQ